MAVWSSRKPACLMTWLFLKSLSQTRRDFPSSETLKMRSLLFWAGGASQSLRQTRARRVARGLDLHFRRDASCKYEPGVTGQIAVDAMQAVLLDGDRTVPELAAVCDAQYRFVTEAQS